MNSWMGLGYFQFDNLIKNRVPFVLLSYGVDFKNYEQGLYQNHLERHLVLIEPEQTLQFLESQKFSKEQSIVLICPTGEISEKMALDLEQTEYKNVFFVSGGYQALLEERKAPRH